jgi:hypothetical protein
MTLSEALAAAQAEFPAVKFDAVNSHFGSRYATLHALLAAVRPALNGHGIFLSQNIHTAGHALYVTTELTKGDEVRRFDGFGWPLPEDTTPQKLAAASTYLKRIALQAALAIAGEDDDDGNSTNEAERTVPPPASDKAPRRPAAAKRPASTASQSEPPGAGEPFEIQIEGVVDDVRRTPTEKGGTKFGVLVKSWPPGWSSTFDESVGTWLEERVGKTCRLDIRRNGRFWNIVEAVEVTPSGGEVAPAVDEIPF